MAQNADSGTTAVPEPSKAIPAPKRVVLTGFMGSGKSTIGRLLARELGWRFYDIDNEIEAAAKTTIAEIFRTQGEPAFRELEHQTVRHFLGFDNLVLALGGGSIEDARTRALLFETEGTCLIHLEASLDTILKRCKGTESLRPVLADKPNLALRYDQRLPLYRQAHINLPVDSLTTLMVVQELLTTLSHVRRQS